MLLELEHSMMSHMAVRMSRPSLPSASDSYTVRRAKEGATIDNRLEDIVKRMFDRYLNVI
jgi:hypothetical protein